eukprot:71383_1
MVYCNYTRLQYKFSQIFRSGGIDVNNHDEFYHLGMNLKIAIHVFGTQIRDGPVQHFYHGMTELLSFPEFMDCNDSINIHCPLSTTSEFPVAAYFASSGSNINGIIIDFGATAGGYTKYFSVAWLSDFSAEREYLFMHNDAMSRIEIRNILEVQTGYEYENILKAFKYINLITNQDHKEVAEIDINLEILIQCVIHHQLSLTIPELYQPFKSLSAYGKQMITHYFKCRYITKNIYINYSLMRLSNFELIFEELCCLEYEWIKMKKLCCLYPKNNTSFDVRGIKVNEYMFEDMLRDLKEEKIKCKVEQIVINAVIDRNVSYLVQKYEKRFQDIGYQMYVKEKYGTITVCNKRNNVFPDPGLARAYPMEYVLQSDGIFADQFLYTNFT